MSISLNGVISIGQVLDQIDIKVIDGQSVKHDLIFVKKDSGQIRRMTVSKKVKESGSGAEAPKGGGFKYRIKETETLLVVDEQDGQSKSIHIPLLVGYNGRRVIH